MCGDDRCPIAAFEQGREYPYKRRQQWWVKVSFWLVKQNERFIINELNETGYR